MKIYKITYSCYESGCSGHEDYFLYKRNAKKHYKKVKGYMRPKLEKITVECTLNFEMFEVGSSKEISFLGEGKEAVLDKILRRYKKVRSENSAKQVENSPKQELYFLLQGDEDEKKKGEKKNLTEIIGPEELKEIEDVVSRIEGPLVYRGFGACAEPYTKWVDGEELAQMIADCLNRKWKEKTKSQKQKGGKTK